MCFGFVESTGIAAETVTPQSEGVYGARVRVSPDVRDITLDLLPPAWADKADLQKVCQIMGHRLVGSLTSAQLKIQLKRQAEMCNSYCCGSPSCYDLCQMRAAAHLSSAD